MPSCLATSPFSNGCKPLAAMFRLSISFRWTCFQFLFAPLKLVTFSNWVIMIWIQIRNRQLSCYLVDLVNDKWISVLVFGFGRSSGSFGADKLFGLSKFFWIWWIEQHGPCQLEFRTFEHHFRVKNSTFDMGKAEHGFGNEFKHDFQPKLVRICCLIS